MEAAAVMPSPASGGGEEKQQPSSSIPLATLSPVVVDSASGSGSGGGSTEPERVVAVPVSTTTATSAQPQGEVKSDIATPSASSNSGPGPTPLLVQTTDDITADANATHRFRGVSLFAEPLHVYASDFTTLKLIAHVSWAVVFSTAYVIIALVLPMNQPQEPGEASFGEAISSNAVYFFLVLPLAMMAGMCWCWCMCCGTASRPQPLCRVLFASLT